MDRNQLQMKFALGTAQFGLNYGVANQRGQVTPDEIKNILSYALSNGLNTLDTAIVYGESEQRLGEIGVTNWRVISKLPAMPENVVDVADWVHKSVEGSCGRLQLPNLYGLLLHSSQELLSPYGKDIYEALLSLKSQGKIQKLGVSIYSPEELDALWSKYKFDLIQAPFNIVDRRLATSGWLDRLHRAGVEVHTRSAFLQGLLLMSQTDRHVFFNRWQPTWENFHRWLAETNLSSLQACLAFSLSRPEISRIVIGVDSLNQLNEILSNVVSLDIVFPEIFSINDEDLVNPSRWNLQL